MNTSIENVQTYILLTRTLFIASIICEKYRFVVGSLFLFDVSRYVNFQFTVSLESD